MVLRMVTPTSVPNEKITSQGEGKTRRFNAERANSRLARRAVIGVPHQGGLPAVPGGLVPLHRLAP